MLVLKPRYPSGCPGRFLQVVVAMDGERRYVTDPIIHNGTVVTAGETFQADIGIAGVRSGNLATGLARPQKRSMPAASISSRAELI